MSLYPVEISLAPGFGWQSAPEFNTLIRALQSGRERRNGQVAQVRHRYTLPYTNITSTAYLNTIKAAFLSVRGQLHAFLVKDPTDFQATLDPLGLAPAGTTPVQLVRTSSFGAASYTRTITRPVAGTVTVYQNGVPKAGTLDDTTGLFTPTTAWTTSAVLTWTGEFRVPVRFASDSLPMSIDDRFGAGGAYAMNGSIELVEVFGE